MRLLRTLGLIALVALVCLVSLLFTGFNESARRGMERQSGMSSIPGDSAFVRSTLDGQVADDFASVNKVVDVLNLAGRTADVNALQGFFIDCNVQRLLGSDDACRRERVASAIEKGRVLKRAVEPVAAPEAFSARLAGAMSFFLPDEPTLRAISEENTWRTLRYDGPGVLRYGSPVDGIYLFVAARNHSEWTIRSVQAVLRLAVPGVADLALECSSHNPYPFSSRAIEPGGATTLACKRPEKISIEDVVSAMHATARDAPPVRVTGFELRSPYAAIADRGVSRTPRFTVAGIPTVFLDARDETPFTNDVGLKRRLLEMDCHELNTCASPYEALAIAVAEPLIDQPLLIPPLIGVLLGMVIGGLVRRSLGCGGALAGLLVLLAIGGIVLAFQSASSGGGEKGFALMAVGALTVGAGVAFLLGLPALFLAIALMRVLRSWLDPESAAAPTSRPAR